MTEWCLIKKACASRVDEAIANKARTTPLSQWCHQVEQFTQSKEVVAQVRGIKVKWTRWSVHWVRRRGRIHDWTYLHRMNSSRHQMTVSSRLFLEIQVMSRWNEFLENRLDQARIRCLLRIPLWLEVSQESSQINIYCVENQRKFKSGMTGEESSGSFGMDGRKKSGQRTDKSRDSSLARKFKQGSEYSREKKSRASKIYSSKSNSSVSRSIIDRIIANKDGVVSDTIMKNLSENEGGGDEAGEPEHARNESYVGTNPSISTHMMA